MQPWANVTKQAKQSKVEWKALPQREDQISLFDLVFWLWEYSAEALGWYIKTGNLFIDTFTATIINEKEVFLGILLHTKMQIQPEAQIP